MAHNGSGSHLAQTWEMGRGSPSWLRQTRGKGIAVILSSACASWFPSPCLHCLTSMTGHSTALQSVPLSGQWAEEGWGLSFATTACAFKDVQSWRPLWSLLVLQHLYLY